MFLKVLVEKLKAPGKREQQEEISAQRSLDSERSSMGKLNSTLSHHRSGMVVEAVSLGIEVKLLRWAELYVQGHVIIGGIPVNGCSHWSLIDCGSQ